MVAGIVSRFVQATQIEWNRPEKIIIGSKLRSDLFNSIWLNVSVSSEVHYQKK
jgi:hypothetical protein